MIVAKYLPKLRQYPKAGVAIAVGFLAFCFALRYFTPLQLRYATFYPAIMLATFVAGASTGLIVAALSATLAVYFFILPIGPFGYADAWGLSAFLLVGLFIIFVTSLLATAVTRLSEQSRLLLISEKRTRTLITELTHRMKNQYAVIQAMARSTGKSAESVPEFLDGFGQRLRALSSSHDLLVKSNWQGVSLSALISEVLEPFIAESSFHPSGPPTEINDVAVVNLGMALNELATNSAKHGAWSNGRGRVDLNWSLEQDQFIMAWSESDGPKVNNIAHAGFGKTVLEHIVPSALEGSSQLKLMPTGLRWTLTAQRTKIVTPSSISEPDGLLATPAAI